MAKENNRPTSRIGRHDSASRGRGKEAAPPVQAQPAPPPATEAPDQLIHLFSLRTILTRPVHLAASSWLEHVPFAFWLIEALRPRQMVEVGTRSGVSYFAFCQAAERLSLDLRGFALCAHDLAADRADTLREHNAALYSGFSRIVVPDGQDDPTGHFDDGSIDLLHLSAQDDGAGLQALLDRWLPRLSDRAVVLLHGTNRPEGGAGLTRTVRDLCTRYPAFDFSHGGGLTVLGIGVEQNNSFDRLFAANGDTGARQAIHAMFSRLGQASADAQSLRETRALYRRAEAEIARLVGELDGTGGGTGAAPSSQPMLAAIQAERDSYSNHITQLSQSQARAVADLSAAQKMAADLRREVEALERQLAEAGEMAEARLATQRRENGAALEQARQEIAGLTARLDAARLAAAEAQSIADTARAAEAQGRKDVAAAQETKAALKTAEHEIARLLAEQARDRARPGILAPPAPDDTVARAELDALKHSLRERGSEVAALTEMVFSLQKSASSIEEDSNAALLAAHAQTQEAQARAAALEDQLDQATQAGMAAREEAQIWQARYHEILGSTSWRVSAPVRLMSRALRRRSE